LEKPVPYNPGGIFSLVASYFANPGTTIRTEQHNPVFEDVGAALSQVLLRDGRAPMTGPLNMNNFAITNVATGNTPGSVATLAQAMPIGAVIDFGGTTAPVGWLLCYGQAISRSTYSALYAIIGDAYGAGDGSTTFNVPDLRGRVVAGRDNLGGTSASRLSFSFGTNNIRQGAATGLDYENLTLPMLPSHNHLVYLNDTGHTHTYGPDNLTTAGGGAGLAEYWFGASTTSTRYGTSRSFTGMTISSSPGGGGQPNATEVAGSNQPHLTIQPTMLMSKIIKASYDG